MQTTSALYKQIYAGPHKQEPKIEIYSPDFMMMAGEFGIDKLVSLKTSRGLFGRNDFCIGNCVSGEITVSFYPTDENGDEVTIPRMAAIKVFVRLVSDDGESVSEWLPKGVFFVDTRQVDKSSGIMTIHGFDAMLKAENLYTDSGNNEYPMSDINLAWMIATNIDVQLDTRTRQIITGKYSIGLPVGYSMREVLGAIAAPYCANFCISDEGKLLAVGAIVYPQKDSHTNSLLVDNVSGSPITFGGVRIIV